MNARIGMTRLGAGCLVVLASLQAAHGKVIDEGLWAPKPALPEVMRRPPPAPGALAPSVRSTAPQSIDEKRLEALQRAVQRPGGSLPLPTIRAPRFWVAGAADAAVLMTQLAAASSDLASAPNKAGERGVGAQPGGVGNAVRQLCEGGAVIVLADRPMTARERESCASSGVSVLEIPALKKPSALVVNAANDWARTLDEQALVTLFQAQKGHITRWRELDSRYPDAPVKLYLPNPDDASMTVLSNLLNVKIPGPVATRLGDPRSIAEAIAFDRNGVGWVPGELANSARLRKVPVVGRDGKALDVDLSKGLLLYVNAGFKGDALYAPVAQRVVQSIAGIGPSMGADAIAASLRAEGLQRLSQGLGGYVTGPDWTADRILKLKLPSYQD